MYADCLEMSAPALIAVTVQPLSRNVSRGVLQFKLPLRPITF